MEFLSEGAGISGGIARPTLPLRRHQQAIKEKDYSEKSHVIHTHNQKETLGIIEPNSVTSLSVHISAPPLPENAQLHSPSRRNSCSQVGFYPQRIMKPSGSHGQQTSSSALLESICHINGNTQ